MHRIFVFGSLQQGHSNFHVNRGPRVGEHWVIDQYTLDVASRHPLRMP